MGFSSVDDMISEITAGKTFRQPFAKLTSNAATSAAGRWHELFTANGIPSAGAFSGAAGTAVQMSDATTGSFYHGGDVSTDTKHGLNMAAWSPTATVVPATLMLVDFLLYYPSLVVTGAPTALTNGVAIPRYTSGEGVMAMVAVQTALGAASPALTFTYTDSGGGTGNVATAITSPVNSAPISTLFQDAAGGCFVRMVAGDLGIRSVQSYTLASGTTGTVALILAKPLATIPILAINTGSERDLVVQIPSLPRIYDGACLGLIASPGGAMVANASIQGALEVAWG